MGETEKAWAARWIAEEKMSRSLLCYEPTSRERGEGMTDLIKLSRGYGAQMLLLKKVVVLRDEVVVVKLIDFPNTRWGSDRRYPLQAPANSPG